MGSITGQVVTCKSPWNTAMHTMTFHPEYTVIRKMYNQPRQSIIPLTIPDKTLIMGEGHLFFSEVPFTNLNVCDISIAISWPFRTIDRS